MSFESPQLLGLDPQKSAPGTMYWEVVALFLTTLVMQQGLLRSANAVPRPIEEERCWLRDDATPHIFFVTQWQDCRSFMRIHTDQKLHKFLRIHCPHFFFNNNHGSCLSRHIRDRSYRVYIR